MAVPTPASLRDLYAPPSNAWSFVPPALQENSSSAPDPPLAGPSSSNQWSTRTAPNPFFELSSSLSGDDSGLDVTSLAKEFLAAALLQYATNAIAQPWEVGKTLLQVQWVPREPELSEGQHHHDGVDGADDDAEVRSLLTVVHPHSLVDVQHPCHSCFFCVLCLGRQLSDSSNENDSYFADPAAERPPKPPRPADEHGYIIRQSVLEEGTQPDYVIPVGSADGTWGMMKQLGGFRAEGWLALWKGMSRDSLGAVIMLNFVRCT